MKSSKNLALAGLLAASLLPALALAGTESGFYIGASVGQASVGDIDVGEVEISFDGDDTGYKGFVGFNFGWIPLVDLAVEGGYVDFGKPDDGGIEVDANGFDLFGLVGINLGPFGLFGKAGMVNWDADASSTSGSGSDDGTDPAYGIGARFVLGSIEMRAEYEYFDIDAADGVDFLSLGAAWRF